MSRAIIGLDDNGWMWSGINFATLPGTDEELRNRRRVELRAAKKKDRRARRKAKRG